jgi:5-(carboxyamino)imidazole ribonucleotide mutase
MPRILASGATSPPLLRLLKGKNMAKQPFDNAFAHEVVTTCQVIIATGSINDWDKGKGPLECAETFTQLGIHKVKRLVVSAHRTPHRITLLSRHIECDKSIVEVIIDAAGGAAHLPGMFAAELFTIPVIGLPIQSKALSGIDSLYSIVQMPPGVPVGCMAIGGGVNAALYAAQILGRKFPDIRAAVKKYRQELSDSVVNEP